MDQSCLVEVFEMEDTLNIQFGVCRALIDCIKQNNPFQPLISIDRIIAIKLYLTITSITGKPL